MKNTSKINFRLPINLKEKIENLSKENNIPTSDMARKMLENYGESFINHEEMIITIWKNEILQLVIWLYQKRLDQKAYDEEYDIFLNVVYWVRDSKHFSLELKHEFSKVEQELHRVLDLPSYDQYYFQFAVDTNPQKFDFELLEDFIRTPRVGQRITVGR